MNTNLSDSDFENYVERPKSVTLLALGVLSIVVINLSGLINVITSFSFLDSFLPFSPLWLGVIRSFWTILGAVVFLGLWMGKRWAPNAIRAVTILYILYMWIDRLVFANFSGRNNNLLFLGFVSVLMVLVVFWVLNMSRTRNFFGVMNEQSS